MKEIAENILAKPDGPWLVGMAAALIDRNRNRPSSLTPEERIETMHAAENAVIEGERFLGDRQRTTRINPAFGEIRIKTGEAVSPEFLGARMVLESDDSLLVQSSRVLVERVVIFETNSTYQLEAVSRDGSSEGILDKREAYPDELNRMSRMVKDSVTAEEYDKLKWDF